MRGTTQPQKRTGTRIREKILNSASYKAASLGQKYPMSMPDEVKEGCKAPIVIGASYRRTVRNSREYREKAAQYEIRSSENHV